MITRFLFAAEPSQMIFTLFVRGLVLLVKQIKPAILAIFALRDCPSPSSYLCLYHSVDLVISVAIHWPPAYSCLSVANQFMRQNSRLTVLASNVIPYFSKQTQSLLVRLAGRKADPLSPRRSPPYI